jgi:hypothetical protein
MYAQIFQMLTRTSFGCQITIVVSVSVSVAMYCLIQLYVPIATYIASNQPLLKLFAVKAVGKLVDCYSVSRLNSLPLLYKYIVFMTFWQATGLSLLRVFGVVKDVCLIPSTFLFS